MGMVAGFQGSQLGYTDAQALCQQFEIDVTLAPRGGKCASKFLQFRNRLCQGQVTFARRGRLQGIRNVAQGSHSITVIW